MQNIEVIEDVAYGAPVPRGSNYECALDIFKPANAGNLSRAVLVIHGGGWMSQSRKGKRERSIATDLAAA